jgi:CO/xanthine dehydrogenase Mo-binding subunit
MAEPKNELYYIEGMPVPETPKPGEPPEPWGKTQIVGKAVPRVDAYERVSGSAVFPADILLPNMLYGAILRCPHPHARVKRVSIEKALRLPGVRAVISGDTPGANPPWTYSSGGVEIQSRIFDPVCRFEGEPVTAVAAETPYRARDAIRAVAVDYEVLPFVADERLALKADAVPIHKGGNRVAPTNVYARGDVVEGFAEADVVLEQEYRTECEIHTPLEPHGCVAGWDGNRLTIWESTQGVYRVQSDVADILNLPLSMVRVIGQYMGGGFGSKLQAGKEERPAGKNHAEPRRNLPGGRKSPRRQHEAQGRHQKGRDPHRP